MNTIDLVFASDVEEFFYEDSEEAVPEGEPIGLDVDEGPQVRLVLFKNIYWNPQY